MHRHILGVIQFLLYLLLLVFITSKLYIKYLMEYNIIIHIGVFVVSFIIMAIFSPVENENKKD